MDKLICDQCGEIIEDGDEYSYIDIGGHYVHEWCEDEYFEELQECCTTHYIRGQEEE